MKIQNIRIPVISMALAITGLLQGQVASRDLFLAPDIKAFKVTAVSPGDMRLAGAIPVENDAKAVLGWQTATYTGPVVGYVSDAKIGKDLLPVNGAPVHAAPGENSPLLGNYQIGNSIEVLDTGIWWKVKVETAFPVYFIAHSLPPAELAQTTAAGEVEIYPALIEDDTTVFDSVVVTGPEAEVDSLDAMMNRPREPRLGIVSRSYTGQLVRAAKGIGPFKPKAPFELLNNKGKRLVWIDFTEIIMPGTIQSFIGRKVLISGEPVQDEKSREWVVYVRTIQENP